MADDYKKAWSILLEVSDRLHDEEDKSGNLKANGEARGLNHMKKQLEREIDKDATAFLKLNGFNGYGLKKKGKGRQ